MPALLQLCEQWLIARIHFDADLRAKLEGQPNSLV
jgi:hypothetical protein